MGKLAVITAFRSDDAGGTEEMAEEIRQAIEASSLSKSWHIEKIAVIEENPKDPNLPENKEQPAICV